VAQPSSGKVGESGRHRLGRKPWELSRQRDAWLRGFAGLGGDGARSSGTCPPSISAAMTSYCSAGVGDPTLPQLARARKTKVLSSVRRLARVEQPWCIERSRSGVPMACRRRDRDRNRTDDSANRIVAVSEGPKVPRSTLPLGEGSMALRGGSSSLGWRRHVHRAKCREHFPTRWCGFAVCA
jgi:hypothetical protein